MSGPVTLTSGQITAGLWDTSGYYLLPGQFTYSIPTATSTFPGYPANGLPTSGYVAFNAQQAAQFVAAVSVWASYIPETFTQTNDQTSPGVIRIAFAAFTGAEKNDEALTYQGYGPGANFPDDSDIWFNTRAVDAATETFAVGDYAWESVLHELGHALGIKHPFETPVIPAPYESRRYSIMSYTDITDDDHVTFYVSAGTVYRNDDYINPSTPMVLDIAAVQARYGVNTTTAAGDTVYTFDQNNTMLQTIYDAGGNNTIDLSNFTRGSIVDLRPGAYSSIGEWSIADQEAYWIAQEGGSNAAFINQQLDQSSTYTWTDNLGIAFTTLIQNVIGGSAADTLIGNSANNVITGGLGADILTGGGGIDTFKDTLAGHAGDNITDLAIGDIIATTDATYSTFSYQRTGANLVFGGLGMTLSNNPVGHLITRADPAGGVDLVLAARETFANDFNGDGHSDLLWRNTAGGFTVWELGGNALASQETPNVYANGAVGTDWTIQGTLDFNGDGLSDILFRNTAGVFTIWDSIGASFTPNVYVNSTVASNWTLAGMADFNGDGKDDLLWRNTAGVFTEWQSTGASFTANVYANSTVDTSWHIQALADFNGDGKADILWRNAGGAFTIWQSTGSGFTSNTYYDASVDTSWRVAAVGDFSGDGKADLIWRNNSGVFTEWQSTGTGFTPNVYVNTTVGTEWQIAAVGDFNDDGHDDLLFRNSHTGAFTIWQSTGSGFIPDVLTDGSVHTDWSLVTHHYDIV